MTDDAPLILVTHFEFQSSRTVAQGVVVGPTRSVDVTLPKWDGWLLGEYKERVLCEIPDVDIFVSTFADKPIPAIEAYDNYHDPDAAKSVVSAVQNTIDVDVNGLSPNSITPLTDSALRAAFLSPNPELRPHLAQVTIRLRANRLVDFPDATSYIRFLENFEDVCRKAPDLRYSKVFTQAANCIRPRVGLWLPVGIQEGGRLAEGVIHLDTQVCQNVFASTLFLSEEAGALEAGTLLRRVLRWQEAGKSSVIDTVIGEVLTDAIPVPWPAGCQGR